MSTRADFWWKEGVELEGVLKGSEAYLSQQGLLLVGNAGRNPRYTPPLGLKPYRLQWNRQEEPGYEESSEPWMLKPLEHPDFGRLSWEIFDSDDQVWFFCNIVRNTEEEAVDPDPSWKFVKDGKLIKICVSFPEEISSSSLTPEQVARGVKKYRQLKELFGRLNADVLRAWADRFGPGVTLERYDPNFDAQIFRLAKTGPQFLFRPFEENRGVRPGEAHSELRIKV